MSKISKATSKSWWGQNFIAALADFTDEGRLTRGRGYRTDKRVKQWKIDKGQVNAKILGNANAYFGVHTAPTYTTTLKMTVISDEAWGKIIAAISDNAAFICKLMMNEIPDDIEQVFKPLGRSLLPVNYHDFRVMCSCPDTQVPCKHIAGVCYRLAEQLDNDPFLLFELRGLPRKKLHQELAKSSLGEALLQSLLTEIPLPAPRSSYFTRPEPMKMNDEVTMKNFWQGEVPLSILPVANVELAKDSLIPALIIKKGGDYPAFWPRDNSFIAAMEGLYQRLHSNSRKLL